MVKYQRLSETANVKVYNKEGVLIRTSHNLRAIARHNAYLKYMGVKRAVATRCPKNPFNGILSVVWNNGDNCTTHFADFRVLCEWLKSRKGWKGHRRIEDGDFGEIF